MSKGVNKVIIVGNLGQDPESRSFPDGGTVTMLSVATSESWKDRQTGKTQERTEWHRVVCRDRGNYKLGEIAAQYLRKGAKVYICGKLKTRKYAGSDGSDRYTTEIIVDEMQMLDSRSDNAGGYQQPSEPHQGQHAGGRTQQNQQQAHQPQQQQSAGFDDYDDDIPF